MKMQLLIFIFNFLHLVPLCWHTLFEKWMSKELSARGDVNWGRRRQREAGFSHFFSIHGNVVPPGQHPFRRRKVIKAQRKQTSNKKKLEDRGYEKLKWINEGSLDKKRQFSCNLIGCDASNLPCPNTDRIGMDGLSSDFLPLLTQLPVHNRWIPPSLSLSLSLPLPLSLPAPLTCGSQIDFTQLPNCLSIKK